ncbi:VgrG-3 protein [Marinobacterium lacunae]|uniref:VgrG-3 protein n=1 Tax=Marinobacterium lacunae TaxID=1232683 RepID=A0A081G1J8_9GAMM|nr:type VI secretion system tip protein TssI/VgrG [Marinobacterium lacunae]KEA64653.1 VgrG-3 protein [Marinobacterium lacunae]
MARLSFEIRVDGLPDDALILREYKGWESLSSEPLDIRRPCHGFYYQIDLASRRADIKPDDVVDKRVSLLMLSDGHEVQRVNGIARSFSRGDSGHAHTFYALELVPALERLSLRQNSRTFQHKNVPEIVSILLQEMGIEDYAFALKREGSPREFCVQYRETDLDFLHRLIAEEGIIYAFEHRGDSHTLVFTDDSAGLPLLAHPLAYNAQPGGSDDRPYVSALTRNSRADVSHSQLKDYSFKKPAYRFLHTAHASEIDYQIADRYEHYDYPGRYKQDVSGKVFSRIRLEYLRRESETALGKSNAPNVRAGTRFKLADHPDTAANRDWLVVFIEHQGSQHQALEEAGGQGMTRYTNRFTLIPAHRRWQGCPQPRPQVDGPCVAVVVGPPGEEIHCDEHGRVKVHFHWDRYSNGDDRSSCWVRVSQGWAGAQYGTMAIPRIGHEVIVSFLNGDPDQPIVTGRVYHAANRPPYPLPEHKTKTVIRTETHGGQGFNELSFEDQASREMIYLHAQKDYEGRIEHDHSTSVGHDQHLNIEHDRFSRVQGNDHLSVDGEQRLHVKQNRSVEVDSSLHQKVGNKTSLVSGSEIHIKAGSKVVLEAGAEITLKAGGSFIKIDPAGVHLVGSAINLNSGGNPGKGAGYGGQTALLPNGVGAPDTPGELQVADILASQTAMDPLLKSRQLEALKGKEPVCEVCDTANSSK